MTRWKGRRKQQDPLADYQQEAVREEGGTLQTFPERLSVGRKRYLALIRERKGLLCLALLLLSLCSSLFYCLWAEVDVFSFWEGKGSSFLQATAGAKEAQGIQEAKTFPAKEEAQREELAAPLAEDVQLGDTSSSKAFAPSESPAETSRKATSSALPVNKKRGKGRFAVYLVGAVKEEGVYYCLPGSLLLDLLTAGGGLKAEADSGQLNLAEELQENEKYEIPYQGANTEEASGQGVTQVTSRRSAEAKKHFSKGEKRGKIRLKKASVKELESLPGIGPATAQKIWEFLQKHPIQKVEDLMQIPGIGKAKLEKLRPYVDLR